MMKLLTIIGARPQIIKAAAISRVVQGKFKDEISEILLHTGQHYDKVMSGIFFEELGIPQPDYNLHIGSLPRDEQINKMKNAIVEVIEKTNPSFIVIYGDTNSTLAGALAGVETGVPLVHIEAGLRSYVDTMPEEMNRVKADQLSAYLFAPTKTAIENLSKEGLTENAERPYAPGHPAVLHCGDIMYDNALFYAEKAENSSTILKDLGIEDTPFVLSTVHRQANTDDVSRLSGIMLGLLEIAETHDTSVILPLHPRTKACLANITDSRLLAAFQDNTRLRFIDPVSYLDIIMMLKHAKIVITDSGGLQKESFFFKKLCIVLRNETEWVEQVDNGSSYLVDADTEKMVNVYSDMINGVQHEFPDLYGDGHAATFICNKLLKDYSLR